MIRSLAMMWLLLVSSAPAWAVVANWSEEMKGMPSPDRWIYGNVDFNTTPGIWTFPPNSAITSEGLTQPLLDQPKHTLDVRFRFPKTAPTPEGTPGFNHPLTFEQESNGTQTYGLELGWRDGDGVWGTAAHMYTKSLGPPETDVSEHVSANEYNTNQALWKQPFEPDQWYTARIVSNPQDYVTFYLNGDLVYQFEYRGPNGSLFTDKRFLMGSGQGSRQKVEVDYIRAYYGVLSPTDALDASTPSVRGDFDGDSQLTASDINLLTGAVLGGQNPSAFDLTADAKVDENDRVEWVEKVRKTYFGDANLDSVFDSGDFVTVFQAGQYEDSQVGNSLWETGDWNGDREFDSGDFVAAFSAGGYEAGPRASVAAVPEPGSVLLALMGLLGVAARARRVVRV